MTTTVKIDAKNHRIGVILYDDTNELNQYDQPIEKISDTIILAKNTSLIAHVWKGRSIKIYEIETE